MTLDATSWQQHKACVPDQSGLKVPPVTRVTEETETMGNSGKVESLNLSRSFQGVKLCKTPQTDGQARPLRTNFTHQCSWICPLRPQHPAGRRDAQPSCSVLHPRVLSYFEFEAAQCGHLKCRANPLPQLKVRHTQRPATTGHSQATRKLDKQSTGP